MFVYKNVFVGSDGYLMLYINPVMHVYVSGVRTTIFLDINMSIVPKSLTITSDLALTFFIKFLFYTKR